MTCYSPIAGYRSRTAGTAGGYGIVFKKEQSNGQKIEVACGQCIGCRLDKSKEWAIRCVHEAQMHEANCFITLTYNAENLPSDGSLVKEHFQKFMKRLRKTTPQKIRYFHCENTENNSNVRTTTRAYSDTTSRTKRSTRAKTETIYTFPKN